MDEPTQSRYPTAFMARQPIFDLGQRVVGYELLHRSSFDNLFTLSNTSHASSKLIADGLMVLDLQSLTLGKRAFVNVTREVLLADHIRLLPPQRTVVELLEDTEPDDEVVKACRQLRRDGYRLALDDFVYRESLEPLIELAEIVKVDFLATSTEERASLAERLGHRGVRLLAEKVETHEAVEEARRLGYKLFQGFFFSKPVVLSSTDVPGHKLNLLRVLREIHRPELDWDGLEAVIKQDMALCYKLLRYINAAHFGLRQRIRSVRRALILLGAREIRRWVSLVVMTGIGQDRPTELTRQAIVRGRFCETLAPHFGLGDRADDLFLMGMFSLIDAVLGRPLGELLAPLPIALDVKDGLKGGQNPLNDVLQFTRGYERGEWERLDAAGRSTPEETIARLYVDALQWAVRSWPTDETPS